MLLSLGLVCVMISHCVLKLHFPISTSVSIFAYSRWLCFSRFSSSVDWKNFQMPVAVFEVKIAKQIGGRLEQSLHPDLSCTNLGWDVEITRLISETNTENRRDASKDLSMKLGREPIPVVLGDLCGPWLNLMFMQSRLRFT